ncbi:MAG: serine/threonine protein kinase [Candidatus Melainabacteria bacterium]|nr:MAG: serine/threonine protein kinase [Candidatus Melainabacteria bacterium]
MVEEQIGSGGMSVVYRARHLRLNRAVAIKTLKLQIDSKPVYRERFQREIDSLSALNHPNVVTVTDCLIDDEGQPYVVMDLLKGKSLDKMLTEQGPLSVPCFANIALQILSAIEHAHRNGVVHRDIKPGNIVLMDEDAGYAKVVDFGLAKLGQENNKLTHSGEIWGSPPYMSPEQCKGEATDHRSDIYSLGCVFYEMLMGQDPFPNSNLYELLTKHVHQTPLEFSKVNQRKDLPPELEKVVFKAMSKKPEDRYQTAFEIEEILLRVLGDSWAKERTAFKHVIRAQGLSSSSIRIQSQRDQPELGTQGPLALLPQFSLWLMLFLILGFAGLGVASVVGWNSEKANNMNSLSSNSEMADFSGLADKNIILDDSDNIGKSKAKMTSRHIPSATPTVRPANNGHAHSRWAALEKEKKPAQSKPSSASDTKNKNDPWAELKRLRKN